ncbi:hypothetical protein J2847_002576 [Azospirillum agricola]|uniref:SH3 domain-containing protein n=1 Tax=Azospirillum agricola TaxID=1720247 RepID=UPI001AEB2DE0|nr:SH3 domain-containing protein [Azospirillum agricola]MBP2229282.1 hypothetical protein [Azospirillum agricola]
MSHSVPSPRLRVAALALAIGLGGASGPVSAQTAAQTARPAAVQLQPVSGDYVTVGRTNLRQQPSQQGARIALIESGVRLKVTGKVADAPWYAVTREDGRSGYVFADLLRPVAADPLPPAPSPAVPAVSPAAADPVGEALRERLDKMDAALADIRKRVEESAAARGVAERQQALESAIGALRDDIAGLRGAAAEGDRPGGFMDRLIGLQEQISAQIAEQKADLEKLGRRLDTAEEWLKPVKEWSDRTLDGLRPGQGWADWFWSGYSATWSWLTEGWWWQEPAGSAPTAPGPGAAPPPSSPPSPPASNERRTIMG